MLSVFNHLKEKIRMRRQGIFRFQPEIPFEMEFGPYLLKTAQTVEELVQSFKLRHEVFNIEFRGQSHKGLDFDRYDSLFDHLLIYHQDTKRVVGTYRLNLSDFPLESYTGLEFDLSGLHDFEGPYLELGRACISKEHRQGAVISLLWRGIAEYMKQTGAEIVFGCSSVKVNDSRRAALLFTYLKEQNLIIENRCHPTRKFQFEDFQAWELFFVRGLTEEQKKEAQSLIPPLLKSYLKLGSKILARPAFDRDFDCLDFLTVLKRSQMSKLVEKKFNLEARAEASA
ncbi:MAG: GNAT family N-acetyltransferase [Bdellovibrionales bacterium]